MQKPFVVLSWIAQTAAAVILAQTLFFKFTGAPESIFIFSSIGMEPWGRIGVGIGELVAASLLLTPRFAWIGALMAIDLMIGALFFHLTAIGIEVQGDGGTLFGLGLTVLLLSAGVVAAHRNRWMPLLKIRPTPGASVFAQALGIIFSK